ncbi:LamG domain-containing protein [Anaeromyxobacter terrae]|uniref:LamG domain-containing protein n=1 Tax=Anaeromyxobacter terrae TaxID=2925406 RepID=UPI001F58A095|nr:LamG domain-containing protein [Anaeromyxobacter sp. SG22]
MRAALFFVLLAPLPAIAQVTVELGPEEIVMAWNDGQRCGMEDIPDHPARAFVDASGRVHLMAGHFELFQSTGDNLKEVIRDCSAPALSSHHDPDPRRYDDAEWLFSTYTLDGNTVYGLVHDEYHGWEHANCNSSDLFNCWWNAVTLIVSRDGGTTFRHVDPLLPPANVIASSPYDYDPGNTTGPFGFFEPSNILSSDGYYYALMHVEAKKAQTDWGVCLMRTGDLADPASWRGWNGSEFSIVLDRGICPVLQQGQIGKMSSSLSYNGYLRKYLLVGTDGGPTGFHFTASESLTSWPRREVIMPTDLWWTPGAIVMRGYPSLLQPGDPSRSFERTGRSPYLYYTHWDSAAGTFARDLVRRRVRFSLPGDEGRYQVLDLPMNERRGTVTLDASFYGNDAILENGAALTVEDAATGPAAVRLPAGTGAQVRVPHAATLDRAGSLTIEAFVRVEVTPAADATIVEKGASTLRNYGLYVTSRTAPNPGVLAYSFTKPGGGLAESVGTRRIDDGRWHHVAAVHDAMVMTARLYIDGALDVARPLGVPLGAGVNDSDLVIGAGMVGAIDAVVVHDHARTAQEILEAALGAGVELCNGRDDDADGISDDGFACVQATTESRACASAPGGTQTRSCAADCSLPEWPACADVSSPAGEASHPSEGCGCGMGGEPSLAWILLAVLELRRRRGGDGRGYRMKVRDVTVARGVRA